MKLLRLISLMAVFSSVMGVSLSQKALANVADDLTINYNKIVDNCGSVNRPAFLCSGNIIRFTSTSRNYHTWDPSPGSIAVGGVSFTYIRKDIKVNLIFSGKTSGIIYYPSMLKPYSKGRAEVLCSFPTDAWSGERAGRCGASKDFVDSKQCQQLGIYTVDAWYNHFMSVTGDTNENPKRFTHECGFDVSIGVQNTAAAFNETLKGMRKVYSTAGDGYYGYNEISIKTWPVDTQGRIPNPEQLPIQAFFYTILNGNSGLNDARYFQQDYYNVTGIWIPIVKIDANIPNNIKFYYNVTDQQVKLGCSN